MIKRILLGLGGTPYTDSEVRHAIDLARSHHAELTAVTVLDMKRISDVGPVPMGASAASASLVQHRIEITEQAINQAISSAEEHCARSGLHCHVIRESGDPFQELISLWRYHDLTVLALQSLFEYGVVRDPKDMLLQLISRGVRPILAVAREYRPIQKVLIAYNGSMESAKALKSFAQTQTWPNAQVQLACFDDDQGRARAALNDAASYLRAHGITAQTEARPGDAHDRLLDYAREVGADLVVLGSTARARIFRHILGDTALKMVTHSQVPLYLTQ